MESPANQTQTSAPNATTEALKAIDTALKTPGVAEELAAHGAQVNVDEVEAAIADASSGTAQGDISVTSTSAGTAMAAGMVTAIVAATADSGDPHPHELERMTDEGGPDVEPAVSFTANSTSGNAGPIPMPGRSVTAFTFGPSSTHTSLGAITPPAAQAVETVDAPPLTMPDPASADPASAPQPQIGGETLAQAQVTDAALQLLADAGISADEQAQLENPMPGPGAPLEDRVAYLESQLVQMRKIMLHHGLRGPQS